MPHTSAPKSLFRFFPFATAIHLIFIHQEMQFSFKNMVFQEIISDEEKEIESKLYHCSCYPLSLLLHLQKCNTE